MKKFLFVSTFIFSALTLSTVEAGTIGIQSAEIAHREGGHHSGHHGKHHSNHHGHWGHGHHSDRGYRDYQGYGWGGSSLYFYGGNPGYYNSGYPSSSYYYSDPYYDTNDSGLYLKFGF